MTIIDLILTDEELEGLHRVADGRKKMVAVDRELLGRLLVDHNVMFNALRSKATVNTPRPHRARPKLRV